MVLILAALCMAAIIALYFYINPMKHDARFIMRRFVNWFPLGMTYAFLYMGRYNLNVSKNALGSLMPTKDFGMIVFVGTIVYGVSFLVNGPIVDKIGGRKGIMIAAIGASLSNIVMGVLTYLMLTNKLRVKPVLAFSITYAINMYFQSYGAVSIIKVKAYWFHVRERGIFSAIFGTLISFGVYFAFDWGQAIVDMAKANPERGSLWLHRIIRSAFAIDGNPMQAIWAVFFIPACVLVVWIVLDWWLIKDTPEEANFPHLDTHDASSGVMHIELTTMDLLKKVFASRLMLLVSVTGLTMGVVRNGIMQWYLVFADEAQAVQPFSPKDVLLEPFVLRLRQTTAEDKISQYVYSRLSEPARMLLGAYTGGDNRPLQESLAGDLNRIRTGPVIFDSQVFASVVLSTKTKGLLGNKLPEARALELNRSLLLDAYPKQLLNRQFFKDNWGFLLCIFGIIGGFSGMISDRYFQSRRGPPVAICFGIMLLLTGVMAVFLYSSPRVVGCACVLITAAAIGVHALMSGTAAADFGGRKATATCAGIVDGFVYLGGGIQSLCVSRLVGHSWIWWPLFLVPFAVSGGIVALKIWHELPAATRKYIAEVEQKPRLELIPE